MRPRAAIAYTKHLDNFVIPMASFTARDIATIKMTSANHFSDFLVSSFYWDGTTPDPPPLLVELIIFAHRHSLPLVLSGDSNAHHTAWGSTNINKRGERLMECIIKHGLSLFNDGSFTFSNILRAEALDLTISNPLAAHAISDWTISSTPSLSDHSLITFQLTPPCTSQKLSYNPPHRQPYIRPRSVKGTTQDHSLFPDILADLITSHSKALAVPSRSSGDLNDKTDLLQSLIIKAATQSHTSFYASYRTQSRKLSSPWWNPDLKKARNTTRKAWKRWCATGSLTDLAAYKKANNSYHRKIKKSKLSSWRKFCSITSSSQSSASKLIKKTQIQECFSLHTQKTRWIFLPI